MSLNENGDKEWTETLNYLVLNKYRDMGMTNHMSSQFPEKGSIIDEVK